MQAPALSFFFVVVRFGLAIAQTDGVGLVQIKQQHAVQTDAFVGISFGYGTSRVICWATFKCFLKIIVI